MRVIDDETMTISEVGAVAMDRALMEADDERFSSELRAKAVNHPAHYNMGGPKEPDGTAKYEVIKVIEDWGLGFKLGNALKYILRAPHKGTEATDLDKARWYLDRFIYCRELGEDGDLVMGAAEVAEAWSLGAELTDCIAAIRETNVRKAILMLDAYVITKTSR